MNESFRNNRKKIILAGGNGLIGRILSKYLNLKGYTIIILSRKKSATDKQFQYIQWDGKTPGVWCSGLENAFAVINLTGKSINCIHNEKNKRAILSSRIEPTTALLLGCASCSVPPEIFIQFSSIGYYGDTGHHTCDETTHHGNTFLAGVCKTWEDTFNNFPLPHTRKVVVRCGLVLSPDGGLLPPLMQITRIFAGGAAGNGKQYISWIHHADVAGIISLILQTSHLTGVFNATAPSPVTNASLMSELRKVLHRPPVPAAPAWLIRIIARYLMHTEPSLILEGCRALPANSIAAGYIFYFSELADALQEIIGYRAMKNHLSRII